MTDTFTPRTPSNAPDARRAKKKRRKREKEKAKELVRERKREECSGFFI